MKWPLLFHGVPLILAALIAAPVAAHAWRRRGTPGARPLAVMALAVIAWTSLAVVYLFLESGWARSICVAAEFCAISALPPAWFIFSLQFTGRHSRFGSRYLLLPVLVSVAVGVLVATNGRHALVWHDVQRDGQVQSENGVVYWLFIAYGYLLSMGGIVVLLVNSVSSARAYRRQGAILVLAGGVPIITSVLDELKYLPKAITDPVPLSFLASTFLVWWGLFRRGILELIPVAHNVLVDHMTDGMLVLDAQERILETNRAIRALLPELASMPFGKT